MQQRVLVLAALAALALAACDRREDSQLAGPATAPPAADTTDAPAPAEPLAPAPEMPPVGAEAETPPPTESEAGAADVRDFSCESGHRVELVGEGTARVTLADGRVIELPRKPDGVAEYRGEALTFDLDDDGRGGVLGQDEVGGFACEPAD